MRPVPAKAASRKKSMTCSAVGRSTFGRSMVLKSNLGRSNGSRGSSTFDRSMVGGGDLREIEREVDRWEVDDGKLGH